MSDIRDLAAIDPLTRADLRICYHANMGKYPLIIRNRVVHFYRGFMLAFTATVALAPYAALRDGPPALG